MTVSEPELASEEGSCSNPSCTVNSGGSCAIGKELLDCEFYELTEVEEPTVANSEIKTLPLPTGEALRTDELEQVLAEHAVSMVVPLGVVKAGKTTLMCLIFDQVRTRREEPWVFTQSKTILGFVRRSFYASYGSGRATGTTPRTSRLASGLHLHLGLRDEEGHETPIVFVDLSGEHVAALADGKIDPVVAEALAHADHVPIVINGRHIANMNQRARAIYQARALLGMVARQPMPPHVSVSLVVTKADLLVDVDMEPIFDDIARGTIADSSPRFLTADRNSASKDDAAAERERGFGVTSLLAHIARSGRQRTEGAWPSAALPDRSRMLAKMWGVA